MRIIRAQRVAEQMTLAALDLLSGVETDRLAGVGAGLDALAVENGNRGAFFTAFQTTAAAVEGVMDARPGSIVAPRPKVAVNGAAGRKVTRQHPPPAAGLEKVEDRVDHPAQAGDARPPARLRSRQQRQDQRPLPIRHVA